MMEKKYKMVLNGENLDTFIVLIQQALYAANIAAFNHSVDNNRRDSYIADARERLQEALDGSKDW